jgi:hypothetical protein
MIVIDLNGDGNLTDEFNAVLFKHIKYCNSPAIASTTSVHNFVKQFQFSWGLTIPAGTTSGEKLMRDSHVPFAKRIFQCESWAYI